MCVRAEECEYDGRPWLREFVEARNLARPGALVFRLWRCRQGHGRSVVLQDVRRIGCRNCRHLVAIALGVNPQTGNTAYKQYGAKQDQPTETAWRDAPARATACGAGRCGGLLADAGNTRHSWMEAIGGCLRIGHRSAIL